MRNCDYGWVPDSGYPQETDTAGSLKGGGGGAFPSTDVKRRWLTLIRAAAEPQGKVAVADPEREG